MSPPQPARPDPPVALAPLGRRTSANMRLAVGAAAGVVGTVVAGVLSGWTFAALVGWDLAALVIVAWTWATIWPMGPERTAQNAAREDPSRALRELLLVAASVASLVGVGFVIVAGGNARGGHKALLVVLAVTTVVVSWSLVHTTFTLRYAWVFFVGADGGILFNEPKGSSPQYTDFAYMALTIGMTFQVSDTNITSKPMRATVLRHALLSYLFGVVIIAITINFVAGLTK